MTGPRVDVLTAAFLVAVEPSTAAYAAPNSFQHYVSRTALRRLLEALEPELEGTTAAPAIAERLAELRKGEQ